jgi:hypothetical protein
MLGPPNKNNGLYIHSHAAVSVSDDTYVDLFQHYFRSGLCLNDPIARIQQAQREA